MAKTKRVKLSKSKLADKWEGGGGRRIKSYCNYFLITKGDKSFLKEKLNLKGYIYALLMLPFAIPIIALTFLNIGLQKVLELLESIFINFQSSDLLGGLIKREVRSDQIDDKEYDDLLEIKD